MMRAFIPHSTLKFVCLIIYNTIIYTIFNLHLDKNAHDDRIHLILPFKLAVKNKKIKIKLTRNSVVLGTVKGPDPSFI